MTQPKQPLAWNDPVIMLEGDATVADIPVSETGTLESELMLRTVLSMAVSLRRLADMHAPESANATVEPAPPLEKPFTQYAESYWARDMKKVLLNAVEGVANPDRASDRVLAHLHQALYECGFRMTGISPQKPMADGTLVTAPAPVPDYAMAALMRLAAAEHPHNAPKADDGLVHVLALAVQGLRSVLASNQRGYLDGVHRAQADYALGLYRDAHPEKGDLDEPHGRLVP